MTQLLVVVGARPNYMKAASVVQAADEAGVSCTLLDTGQHYDAELSRVFQEEFGLPEPEVSLGVGAGSHSWQTAHIMLGFEEALFRLRPSIVVVVGDVNSTVACALVAAKEHVPVAHVEAGLRSFDRTMPEELNRTVCDHLSSYLFATSRDAVENLENEGIDRSSVYFVGNPMIDTLFRFRKLAHERRMPERLGLDASPYVLVTLHRPSNVDAAARLRELMETLEALAQIAPVVFPVHPRTMAALRSAGYGHGRNSASGLRLMQPLGYLDFVGLMASASVVLTDSGGIQEETTALGVPCLTLRESTERPVTVSEGTNRIVGVNPHRILAAAVEALATRAPAKRLPDLWDGRAGRRIVERLHEDLFAELPVAAAAGLDPF